MRAFVLVLLFIISVLITFGQNKIHTANLIEQEIEMLEPHLPNITPLFDQQIRDIHICPANGMYYLTGTTGDYEGINLGIQIWESNNLRNWRPIGVDGFAWKFISNANSWKSDIVLRNGLKKRALIYPEIHFIKNTFYITYTITNYNKSGILRSTTGKITGPYEDISDEPLVNGADLTLFQDKNERVWAIWNGGKIRKLNEELTGFADIDYRLLKHPNGNSLKYKGINLFYKDDVYYLSFAQWNSEGPQFGHLYRNEMHNKHAADGRYDCMVCTSDYIIGSYSEPYLALPHCGHGNIFTDYTNTQYASLFGNNGTSAPIQCKPAIVRITFDQYGKIKPDNLNQIADQEQYEIVYISRNGNNSNGSSWANAYSSIQKAIDQSSNKTQLWIAAGNYNNPVKIISRRKLNLYGGFKGDETNITERDPETNKVIISGRNYENHVVELTSSTYIKFDGFTITGGNAAGNSFNQQFGGGIYVVEGGETNKFINCNIENNKANKDGAGIYASIGSSPYFINCKFKRNIARRNGGAVAIYCNDNNGYHAQFYNCVFDQNKAIQNGGAIYFNTNLNQTGLLRLANCVISNNYTESYKGAITLERGASLLMVNSTICYNHAFSKAASVATLGRIPAQNRIINCIFMGNSGFTLFEIEGADTGNSIENLRPWTQFRNCIFYSNNITSLVERNFDNKKWRTVEELNESSMARNCYNVNPKFRNPTKGDLHLTSGSPAINKGTLQSCFRIDMDGDIRPTQSGQIDIGTDEFSR